MCTAGPECVSRDGHVSVAVGVKLVSGPNAAPCGPLLTGHSSLSSLTCQPHVTWRFMGFYMWPHTCRDPRAFRTLTRYSFSAADWRFLPCLCTGHFLTWQTLWMQTDGAFYGPDLVTNTATTPAHSLPSAEWLRMTKTSPKNQILISACCQE